MVIPCVCVCPLTNTVQSLNKLTSQIKDRGKQRGDRPSVLKIERQWIGWKDGNRVGGIDSVGRVSHTSQLLKEHG